jgi:hypothetical protein
MSFVIDPPLLYAGGRAYGSNDHLGYLPFSGSVLRQLRDELEG